MLLPLFFSDTTPTTEIYTLSLHDALPIWHHRLHAEGQPTDPGGPVGGEERRSHGVGVALDRDLGPRRPPGRRGQSDRKSTRLNSSHRTISYAVFCLKKKKNKTTRITAKAK